MKKFILGMIGLALLGAPAAWGQEPDPAEVEKGRKLFKFNCYTCHVKNDPYEQADASDAGAMLAGDPLLSGEELQPRAAQNVWGPDLRGVYMAQAGRRAEEGYLHSQPFLEAAPDIVWTEENLDRWLKDTNAMIPGTWMRFKVPDDEKRRLIIEFVKQYE